MGSGISRTMTGAFKGTGSLVNVRTVGFRPSKVELYNEDGLSKGVWTETMADGDCIKTITVGTMSKVTSNGITPLSNGFSLGADADLNVLDELVHWVAHE